MTDREPNSTRTVPVPTDVLRCLLNGCAEITATEVLTATVRSGRQDPLHPINEFGQVLAWAWSHDQHRAMLLIADLMSKLGHHSDAVTPPYRLDELLDGLRYTTLALSDTDYEQLVRRAKAEVPGLCGRPEI
ncbi:MAG: hypothetical protein L0I76_35055 [Pseudonocardia sp.]|nr:hypothetical protein [Pseudonocardia sp.]